MMPTCPLPAALRLGAEADDRPLRERVADCVQGAILSGLLPPGSVLSEQALALHLGVSRTPVHDALHQLVGDGLVWHDQGQRARVASVTAEDVRQIFAMRLLLECAALRVAVGRLEVDVLAGFHREAGALAAASPDAVWLSRWTQHDGRFHAAIAAAGDSRYLQEDIVRYHRLHRGLNRHRADAASLHDAAYEHQAICAALQAGDAVAAEAAMRSHILRWQAFFVARLQA